MSDEAPRQVPFTDDDLFFWKNLCGNHLTDEENLEIHPMTLGALLARLEAAEKVLGIPHRCRSCGVLQKVTGKFFEAWRKAAGK